MLSLVLADSQYMNPTLFQFAIAIPSFVLGSALFIVLLCLYIKTEKARRLTLQIMALLLITGEVAKILSYVYEYHYLPVDNIPMYLCSLFVVTFTINAFSAGRVSKFLLPFSFYGALFAGIAQLIQPYVLYNLLVGPESFSWIGIHSLFFHVILIVFSIQLVVWKYYKPTFLGTVKAISVIVVTGLIMIAVMEPIYSWMPSINFFELGRNDSAFAGIFDIITYPVGVILYFIGIWAIFVATWAGYKYIPKGFRAVFKKKQ